MAAVALDSILPNKARTRGVHPRVRRTWGRSNSGVMCSVVDALSFKPMAKGCDNAPVPPIDARGSRWDIPPNSLCEVWRLFLTTRRLMEEWVESRPKPLMSQIGGKQT